MYIEALSARIIALQAMRETVMQLADTCDGGASREREPEHLTGWREIAAGHRKL